MTLGAGKTADLPPYSGTTATPRPLAPRPGRVRSACSLRFLDRLQVGDDRADIGVLENELRHVVAGHEALAQSLLERLDGIPPAQGAEHGRFWVGTFASALVAWQRAQLRVTSVSPRSISAVPCADAIDPMQTDAAPPMASPSAIILISGSSTTQRGSCRRKKPRHRGQGFERTRPGCGGHIRTCFNNDEGAEAFRLLAMIVDLLTDLSASGAPRPQPCQVAIGTCHHQP
jgi:hypothetical protein